VELTYVNGTPLSKSEWVDNYGGQG
jgi:hypothetical protein